MPALLQDLHHWSHLYVAGRLHKPVAALVTQPAADAAVLANLHAALSTALLLQPQPTASLKVRTGMGSSVDS
jgi:translocator assembly and maintenance protein 41